ncbi:MULTISPECIES: tRNA1(Val) (adenine(37)-N6)-methyltransferase [Chitinophagaceae]
MGNNYFRFKQFSIQQDKTAMKVCTDACLFGAYLAGNIDAEMVLDIGAGTGLLSLMYVQKHPRAWIDAIEIEENAFAQAKENVARNLWSERIHIRQEALQEYVPKQYQYDLILSNPPFYDNDLKSGDQARNMAMHSTQLSLMDIFSFAKKYLEVYGRLALLLPFHRTEEAEKTATQNGFFLQEKLLVRQTPRHHFFRSILVFVKEKQPICVKEITIKNVKSQYDTAFVDMLRDYYLFL